MGKTIAITNQKGGVGKTTTAINLTACLAEIGKKILLIDLDPQGNSTSGLGLRAGSLTVYEALMGRAAFAATIVETGIPGLKLAPADIRLAGAELELVDMRTFCPSSSISPDVGGNVPASTFISVDFPAPFSPSRPTISPGRTVKFT